MTEYELITPREALGFDHNRAAGRLRRKEQKQLDIRKCRGREL